VPAPNFVISSGGRSAGLSGVQTGPGARVDADAAIDQLRRERFREGVNSALGHRIVEQRLAPFDRRRQIARSRRAVRRALSADIFSLPCLLMVQLSDTRVAVK
jgi:hypothetical protein